MRANYIQQQLLAEPFQRTYKMECSGHPRQDENCEIFSRSAPAVYDVGERLANRQNIGLLPRVLSDNA